MFFVAFSVKNYKNFSENVFVHRDEVHQCGLIHGLFGIAGANHRVVRGFLVELTGFACGVWKQNSIFNEIRKLNF